MPDQRCGERKNKTPWEVEPNFTFDPALFGFPARGHNLQLSGCPNNRRGDYRKAKASWQAFSKVTSRHSTGSAGFQSCPEHPRPVPKNLVSELAGGMLTKFAVSSVLPLRFYSATCSRQ